MRKAFRHTGVLMMVAVVALGLLGAAYTLWYDKLTLTATVQTGTLDANWSFHKWDGAGTETFSATNGSGAGKPVVAIVPQGQTLANGGASILLGTGGTGSGAANFLNSNFHTANGDKPQPTCNGTVNNANDTMTLTMSGLFPFAGCAFTIDLESVTNGVPFHLAITDITVDSCTGGPCAPGGPGLAAMSGLPWTRGVVAPSVSWSQTTDYDKCVAFFNADWKSPAPPKQILYPNGPQQTPTTPIQIHDNTPLKCTFMLVLDENWRDTEAGSGYYDPAHWYSTQGMSFQVTTHYVAYQWNENPDPTTLSTLP